PQSYKDLNIKDIINEKGTCHGWSILFQIYYNLNLEEHFFNILMCISEWDENEHSLEGIPNTLQRCYVSRTELINYIISHLVLLQANSSIVCFDLNLSQDKMKEAFNLLNPGGKFLNEFDLPLLNPKTPIQLVEFIELLSKF